VQRIHADLVQLAPGVYLQQGEATGSAAMRPAIFLEEAVSISTSADAEAEAEASQSAALATEAADALSAANMAEADALGEIGQMPNQGAGHAPNYFNGGDVSPRRYRGADILGARPGRVRYEHLNTPSPDPNREAARQAYRHLYQSVYQSFEALCTRRMPFAYLPYCKKMLRSYRYIAQGIHYGDRPEQICINGGFCDKKSYVRKTAHTIYKPEKGDAKADFN